jgi:predicted amidophosphoribosyltransferase
MSKLILKNQQKTLKVCHYCGQEFKGIEEFCTKKCKNLDGIVDVIQKIKNDVDSLKNKSIISSDQSVFDLVKTIEASSIQIAKKISAIQFEVSK